MAEPAAPTQQSLVLEGFSPMTLSQAARRLAVSQAQICRMILVGELRQVAPRFVDSLAVESIAASLPTHKNRRRRDPSRLPRTTESLLWLLDDWGGSGGVNDLAAAMEVSWQNADRMIQNMDEAGLVTKDGKTYAMTTKGRAYVKEHRSSLG